ncbi:hypothetical protein NEPAR06_1424 [Nematocida parisii]|uniref:DUF155 domain-containing protein n=1 Tax=Nematocida parisii (strain ERTm3) TaxID=935791 RepID=I3EEE4_NEMP3|nr:uncharacterized protein NEPG_02217 [Nematocida parisii ERTm1]EIJ87591.1 hypothetical protein NEQG_02138 [Nematocida parisii ERTm3]KAI5126710.1 hypothetical protein NEPAR03_0631 [Nematocida parisii]KAI5166657.1 hypothetical protein NEIRO02_1308 [Nematocida sp. AWRm79]KAI5183495.1 hypothetical protein NEIRO03_1085 [Nematocida sp. AWRm78]OAG33589.1 hypothetical protein NEIG_02007 [Nematocida sp. ERTm5]|eukprot:XP_013060044.1 hypothetical protein NEPG_02217 [Nematocida parisii ERTm1]
MKAEAKGYAEPNDTKRSRIENRRVSKEALELKTIQPAQKQSNDIDKSIELKDILVLCTAEKINIIKLFGFLKERATYPDINIYFRECIHIMTNEPNGKGDIFIFRYGVVVFWGISEESRDKILAHQQFFEEKSYSKELVEREDFRYGIVREGASIINDVIYLDNETVYNKMIISNALAQSTKLDVFERHAERTIESVRGLPDEIVAKGFTTRKREEVVKLIGVLHRLKFNLNLSTNILDTPEILWYYPNYTSLYESFKLYLELKSRTEIVNQKCDVIHEILTLLSTHINTMSGERLEKIIIILITLEIGIGLVSMYFNWAK